MAGFWFKLSIDFPKFQILIHDLSIVLVCSHESFIFARGSCVCLYIFFPISYKIIQRHHCCSIRPWYINYVLYIFFCNFEICIRSICYWRCSIHLISISCASSAPKVCLTRLQILLISSFPHLEEGYAKGNGLQCPKIAHTQIIQTS